MFFSNSMIARLAHSFFGANEIPICLKHPKTMGLRADAEDPVVQVLATSAYSLQRTICIMDNSGLILSEADAKEASSMLLLHCKTYCWLSARFFRDRVLLFRIRPKLHYIVHQAWQVKELKLNLSGFTTFEEESFLGKIKGIICACHGSTCYVRFYQRYLLCLALMVRRHRQLDTFFEGVC